MKKYRLFLPAAAALLIGAAITGCGSTNDSGGDATGAESTAPGQSTDAQASETSDTNAALLETTQLETNTTITTAQTDPANAQTSEYMRYLKDLYNDAGNYAKGYPQKISGIDDDFSGVTTYLKYGIADIDGDGKLELITLENNYYMVEKDKVGEDLDKGYLTFRRFKTNDGGGIVESKKINGLSNGISFATLEKNTKCYDNGIICIDETDAANAAWGYNYDDIKVFLYFDDDVVKSLNVPAINEYLDSEWAKDKNSSYVLMQAKDGVYEICLGGAQDSYTEMTQLTKEQYDSMVKTLTGGKEVGLEFKDINKENLGI